MTKQGVSRLVFALLCSALSLEVSAQSSVSSTFDHFTTGFRLEGAHQFAECESCHVDGMFTGTPTQCVGCHSSSNRVRASTKPPQHILATEQCDACHRPAGWVPIVRMDHLEAVGTCFSCHDGRRAMGKPPNHLPTNDVCDNCHRTITFSPARFDHAGIVGNCFSCHNGTTANGKPPTHIPATNICEDCHNVVMWSPVARVDHLQVLGTCSSCHNGVIAQGQHPGHIPTTEECDSCHNTVSFR